MKKNNQLLNLLINIAIPAIILTKLSREAYLAPVNALLIALPFPLAYGLYDFIVLKQKNFISILGFVGVLLSGSIAIFKFPPQWLAVKEASIPLIIGIVVLISTKTSWQLLKKFIYNREVLDIDQIETTLSVNNTQNKLEKTLNRANILLAFSFFFSAILNYVLAVALVRSMPGTPEFNEEIGRMTALSFPVIALPSTIIMVAILWYLIHSIKKLTNLSLDELMAEKFRDKKKEE